MSKGRPLGTSYPKTYNPKRLAGLRVGLEELWRAREEVDKRGEWKVGSSEQRGEKWRRRVEFIEGENTSMQGPSPNAFALVSTSRTTDMSDPDHMCLLDQTVHKVGSTFWAQGCQCNAIALYKGKILKFGHMVT